MHFLISSPTWITTILLFSWFKQIVYKENNVIWISFVIFARWVHECWAKIRLWLTFYNLWIFVLFDVIWSSSSVLANGFLNEWYHPLIFHSLSGKGSVNRPDLKLHIVRGYMCMCVCVPCLIRHLRLQINRVLSRHLIIRTSVCGLADTFQVYYWYSPLPDKLSAEDCSSHHTPIILKNFGRSEGVLKLFMIIIILRSNNWHIHRMSLRRDQLYWLKEKYFQTAIPWAFCSGILVLSLHLIVAWLMKIANISYLIYHTCHITM